MKRQAVETASRPGSDAADAGAAPELELLQGNAVRRSSSVETLAYLIELTVELKELASSAGFSRLGLILMLAEQEARQQQGRGPG